MDVLEYVLIFVLEETINPFIVHEAVEIETEFVCDALPCELDSARQY